MNTLDREKADSRKRRKKDASVCSGKIGQADLWFLAQTWVKSNYVLVWCIAAPYYRYMPCDSSDLEHEAILTAYQVMSGLMRKDKKISLMSRYYRVVFRSRCMSLATGVIVTRFDLDRIPGPEQEKQQELDEELIHEALRVLTNRQRQISQWILSQPTPVSTSMVAAKYGVQRRTIQAILSNAIDRLKNGNQRLCPAIQTVA